MSEIIFRPWDGGHSDRSAGDRARHRQKVRQAIKEQIGDIISEESIIGKQGGKIVKVPLRGIKEYRFIYGDNKGGVGQGEGGSRPGTIIGKHSKRDGQGKGEAGDRPGVDYYETEITLEELLEIMFEDLKLPYLERRRLLEITVYSKKKPLGYRRKGIRARLSLERSARERVKRLQETKLGIANREREIAILCAKREELKTGQGELEEEIKMAKEKLAEFYQLKSSLEGINQSGSAVDKGRFPFSPDDLRYHHHREKPRKESNAVVVCIMDVSGSMDTIKKYLARSFFFLLHRFVTTRYQNVEIVFIAHDTDAQEVTEEEFFHKGESGGTMMSSGLEKALEVIAQRYHPSLWNIYAFHCSDGDNFSIDNEQTLRAAKKLCQVANLFGYGEIKPDTGYHYKENGMLDFLTNGVEADNFKAIEITGKEDLWPGFKELLAVEKEQV